MRFLKLRTAKTSPRADGSTRITPLIVDAPRKFAPHKDRREQTLSLKRCQLIFGAHDSGKTRWLTRMHENWHGIWGAKIKAEPVFLSALMPLSSWVDNSAVADWHDEQQKQAITKAEEAGETYRPRLWDNLNQQQKADRLADYVANTGALVFVDDAHKLTGRKLQIARACIISARIWLVTASQENRLPPNLRPVIDRRDPQRTRLHTDASYDATSWLVWMLIVAALGVGWWEAGLILGGLKMLGTGRTAARPD